MWQAPFVAVALFGVYSIVAVLHGVFTFRDCPEEAESLRQVPSPDTLQPVCKSCYLHQQ